ncbi:hypothetical protein Purlil1_13376 [Purpureocillium lilacinum]|uniref:Rhodopsin domain-containing protein n=1 Tax=Purpureocillium lilacinum TaxID=33203 RepID=A0ABR0BEK4_PURLI|nr:hypothetical protein Purlil1_13376 [Purpureocillium lilacinum]
MRVSGVATTLITVVRLVFKRFYSQQKVLHPDDWITAVSLALCLSGVAVGIGGLTPAGLGKDIWTLNISKVAKFATYFYAMELIYISGVSLIKLSLTLFYLRVFPGNMIRLFLWGTILLNTLYGVVFGSIAIFQCSPVSYYWDQYSGDAQGHCININLFGGPSPVTLEEEVGGVGYVRTWNFRYGGIHTPAALIGIFGHVGQSDVGSVDYGFMVSN